MQKIDFQEFLQKDRECSCKKVHRCDIETILISKDALQKVPELIKQQGYQKICIIEDNNTKQVAGDLLEKILKEKDILPKRICFDDVFLIPDEAALGRIITEIDRETDLILAVGSGTLNDLCKFISYQLKMDYYIIATAPSMDGYASNVAPLISNHAKVTYEVSMPRAIIGDLSILKEAPMNMIAAGVGDVLGKYVCLMDWKMSHIVTGEYYCTEVVKLVEQAIDKVMQGTDKLALRDEDAILSIMEGLILSGIGMSYIGNSRPASGSEHHLSHYWEMMALLSNGHLELHGTKVAIGTVIGLRLYEKFFQDLGTADSYHAFQSAEPEFHPEQWSAEIRRVYLGAADSVIALENTSHKNAPEEMKRRKEALLNQRDLLQIEVKKLPKADQIIKILKLLSAKSTPEEVGVSEETLRDSILYAKELRNRFGILQVLKDFGLQDAYAEEIIEYFRSVK